MKSNVPWSRAASMMTMSPRIIALSILYFSLAVNAEEVPCGDPLLQGGGLEKRHCNCTEGWTGIDCFVKVEECDGGHKCYYGGQCIPDLASCNCANAVDFSGNKYRGKYCEHPAESVCDEVGRSSCINGGKCNPHYLSTGNPCVCPYGYGGENCEYKPETISQCEENCKNGGVCKLSLLPSLTEAISWCQCPPGFLGNSCETPVAPCGQLYCLNGGVCRSENECRCGHEWTGPSCEVMKIPDIAKHHGRAPVPEPVPTTPLAPPPISPSNQTSQATESEAFLATILLFAILATSACVCCVWGRRRVNGAMGYSRGMLFGDSDFRDNSTEKNIAPKMDDNEDDDDEFFAKFISPVAPAPDDYTPRSAARRAIDADNRAPMLVYNRVATKESSRDDTNAASPPELYLGPPRDEDGNELYSIEFL